MLKEVKPVFTEKDNEMFLKTPTKDEVKESLWFAKINAAPGTSTLCTDIAGTPLEIV